MNGIMRIVVTDCGSGVVALGREVSRVRDELRITGS
jgi:hypothetical protein